MPLVSRQPGLIAQHLGRPGDRNREDVESIQAFAGERWPEAVIVADEEHLLKSTSIEHYDVIPWPGSEA